MTDIGSTLRPPKRTRIPLPFACVCLSFLLMVGPRLATMSQPGTKLDLPKPEKYKNRTLASERSTTGRLGVVRRFTQNIGTHYNFHFNASMELEEVVSSARRSNRDDFTARLPFYDVDLTKTASQATELDSVILKCNNGILLHDLRNDWVDDLYLLMGKAYYYRNDADSAIIAFQYINQAFQPRDRDEIGSDKAIGSRFNSGGNASSIATPEKKGIASVATHTPARNEAILWLVRSLIAKGAMDEARGLLETLRRDPNMPGRLKEGLEEMEALWYYEAGIPDSAASHLVKALDGASDNREKARWEFLAAQLYRSAGDSEAAGERFERAIRLTTDPVMEAYARIHRIGLYKSDSDSVRIREGTRELLQMAEKARYEEYRHLIYHAAARLQSDLGNTDATVRYLQSSLKSNRSDSKHKNQTFLELGDLAYRIKDYRLAKGCYDSASLEDLPPGKRSDLEFRKGILTDIVFHLERVRAEDSLQRIAAMPEEKREELVRSMVRKWRKEQGLKEDDASQVGGAQSSSLLRDGQPADLFTANDSKGEWYFYNTGLKSQGFRQFQSRWGKRPNLDNWRRIAAVNSQLNAAKASPDPTALGSPTMDAVEGRAEPEVQEMTVEALLAKLPLTEDIKKASDDSIQSSLFSLGKVFHERLDDCGESIRHLEALVNRYPRTPHLGESLYILSLCHRRSGDMGKSEFYRSHLEREQPGSRLARRLKDPIGEARKDSLRRAELTRSYEDVYTNYTEGRYEEARRLLSGIEESQEGNPWSPQLLYMDAALKVREGKDSQAIGSLEKLVGMNPDSSLGNKAKTLQDVLKRRGEIESSLAVMKVTRDTSEGLGRLAAAKTPTLPVLKTDTAATAKPPPPIAAEPPKQEQVVQKMPPPPPVAVEERKVFSFDPKEAHGVAMILEKADVAYVSEARYALNRYNGRAHAGLGLEVVRVNVDKEVDLVLVRSFPDAEAATAYLEALKREAGKSIVPWMPAGMYFFLPMTDSNLEVLKRDRDLPAYVRFIRSSMPGKF